ncbi:uncharacterized protein LOC135691016 [Rhopilema esculentum]|uniref:uncharacterized protein LOC135691016 n=1 Tax=Rhopilema esculentum TaxID=499914 RepID=UPI0031D97D5D|eukprot:gene1254-15634_t
MRRGKDEFNREDSFTSVTSASSESSVEIIESSKKRTWKTFFKMGQKNTHESTTDSRQGSAKGNPTSKKNKDAKLGVSDKPKKDELRGKNGDEFVDVLESDGEEAETGGSKEKSENKSPPIKFKLTSLMADSDSEEYEETQDTRQNDKMHIERMRKSIKRNLAMPLVLSSDDDYDQPEEVENSSRGYTSKDAVLNWRRLVNKMLQNKDHKEEREDNENKGEKKLRALKNWRTLAANLKDTSDLFTSKALKEIVSREHIAESYDDVNSPTGSSMEGDNEINSRAIENWQLLASKVMDKANPVTSFKKLIRKESFGNDYFSGELKEEMNERTLKNWEKLVSGLLEGIKETTLAGTLLKEKFSSIMEDNAEEIYSDGDDSELSGTEMSNSATENWRRILSKIRVGSGNIAEFVKQITAGSFDEKTADKNDSQLSIEIVRKWEKIVCKLLEKYEDKFPDIKKFAEGYALHKRGSNDESESIYGESSSTNDGLKRPVRNWKKLAAKILDKDKRELGGVKTALSMLGNGKRNIGEERNSSNSDSSSVEEVPQRVVTHWESLVKSCLTKYNGKSYARKIFEQLEEKRSKLSEGNNEVNSRAMQHWKRIRIKMLQRNKGEMKTVAVILSDIVKKEEDSLEKMSNGVNRKDSKNEMTHSERTRQSKKAENNWRELTRAVLEASERKPQNIRETLAGRLKEQQKESGDKRDEKRTLENWKRLTKAILEASEKKPQNIRETLAGRLKEQQKESGDKRDEKRILENWKRLTKAILEASEKKPRNIRETLAERLNEQQKRSSNEEEKNRALENWQKLGDKLKGRDLGKKSVYEVLKGKIDSDGFREKEDIEIKEKSENDEKDRGNGGSRAERNWKKLLSNVLALLKTKETFSLFQLNLDDLGYDVCYGCKNKYEFPILLSCSHTFCRDCITRFIDDSDGEIFGCPLCGARNVLSEKDEELFCPNFVILKKMLKDKCGDDGCRYCGKEIKSQLICYQCAERYCKKCADRHMKYESNKHHTLSEVDSTENIENMQRKYYCLKHPEEELSNYCLDCDVSICPKCAKKKHKRVNHDCGAVSEAAMAGRKIVRDAAKRLEGEHDYESELLKIEKMQQGVDVELAEMRQEIKANIERLIAKLKERETQLYKDVEEKHRITYEALSERRQSVEAAMLQKDNLNDFLKELKNHQNGVEMLQMQATISERMSEILDLQTSEFLDIDYDFVFRPQNHKIENKIEKYGRIDILDRKSGGEIFIERIDDEKLGEGEFREKKNDEKYGESDRHAERLQSWSPTSRVNTDRITKENETPVGGRFSDEENEVDQHRDKPRPRTKANRKKEKETKDVPVSTKTGTSNERLTSNYEEIKQTTYEFEGTRTPPYEGFTQLTTERGERINVLKYGVKDYKNKTCDVQLRMICPDQSIVSAHVAENADGTFTVFFCPDVKRDFNCFIAIGGKDFKREYKILNFYGDFQGMKSKEIDLACRAMSLLRWHITPGLLEAKNGKIRRSKKFFRIVGTHR